MRFFLSIIWMIASLLCAAQQQKPTQGNIGVHYYEKANTAQESSVAAIISASFQLYIEKNYVSSNNEMSWLKSEKEIIKDLESIVKGSIKFYHYKELESFKGFSDDVLLQVKRMNELNEEKDPSFDSQWTEQEVLKRKYIFYKKEIDYLQLLLDTEIGYFTSNNLLALKEVDAIEVDTNSFSYNAQSFLEPQEILFSDATLQLLGQKDESTLNTYSSDQDTTLFGQIRRLMMENNRRMDRLEDQVNAMRIDQLEWMDQQNKERDQMLQAQIDDLKGMVFELVKINAAGGVADIGTNAGDILPERSASAVNVPSFIDIYFEKNATKLSVESQLVLSEVVDIAARNSRLKLIITGMADKSGNEVTNLLLSQERAKSVKSFFVKAGLPESRFIVRYTGSSKSEVSNSTDRKVRMEFIEE